MNNHILRASSQWFAWLRHLPIYLLLVSGLSCRLTAQITDPVQVVNGRSYYMHTVEKRETLYSLSKKFNCDINEILSANPGADNGIAEGQVLKIPVTGSGSKPEVVIKNPDAVYVMHEVKRRETLYSISREYNVDINKIVAANPGCDTKLSKGDVLKIPLAVSPAAEPAETPKTHLVQPGETLYSIARKYEVSVSELEKFNTELLKEGLKAGQQLAIPDVKVHAGEKEVPVLGEALKSKYGIALMLPFMSHLPDSVSLSAKDQKLREVAMDLYRGVLIAADTMQQKGLNADLFVYDVYDGKGVLQAVLNKPEFAQCDLIIGPLSRDLLPEVNAAALKQGMQVVCPIPLTNKVLLDAPNLSKAQPSLTSKMESLGRFIAANHQRDNVLLINTTNLDDQIALQAFKAGYLAAKSDSVAEFKLDKKSFTGLKGRLSASKTNIIVMPSNDQLLITALFNTLSKQDNVIVYGLEEWEGMEFIDMEKRNDFQLRYAKAQFVDYSSEQVKQFVRQYRKRFKTEPGDFAFMGYDLMFYYSCGLQQFGRTAALNYSHIKCPGLLSSAFDYSRAGENNGYENRHIFVVSCRNYELTTVGR